MITLNTLQPDRVRVVTFDCYGTLIDWETGIWRAFREAALHDGVTLERERLIEAYHAVEPEVEGGEFRPYRDVLAETARASPRVARMLAGATDRDVLLRIGAMPEGATFVAAFEQFIATYGHRGVREIELAAPRWGEDPVALLPLIRARINVRETQTATHSAPRRLPLMGRLHRPIVNALAKRARRFGALRENTRQFHVLALTTVRRKILALLRKGPLSAGELSEHFDIAKPTLSVHLSKLKDAELVSVERRGTSLIYHLNMSILEEALSGFLSLKDQDQ